MSDTEPLVPPVVEPSLVGVVFAPPVPLTLPELRAKISGPLTILTTDLQKPLAAINGLAKFARFIPGMDIGPAVAVVQEVATVAQEIGPVAQEVLSDDEIMEGVLWLVNLLRLGLAKYRANKKV